MKLLRTIRLDASDSFVFEKPAEPGEWAVSGAFVFAASNPSDLTGKARTAFRAGFLGLRSLGRSTLAQIVETHEKEYRAVVELLAEQLVKCFGAPSLATARVAAEEEINFAASLLRSSAGRADRGDPNLRQWDHPRGISHAAATRWGRTRRCFRVSGSGRRR